MSPARFPDWVSLSRDERIASASRCFTRAESIGRSLNAVSALYAPAAKPEGPLDGIPYFAKDMIATGQSIPSWGCANPVAKQSAAAAVITALNKQGGMLMGAAEMTELAYEPSGMNAARGRVRNPWREDAVTGGSSSGSAALVAAGCCFMALGSDTGGSVRLPAHCCGITALKPTHGAISAEGTMPLAPSLDTIGILTRSAADLSAVWRALKPGGDAGAPSGLVMMSYMIGTSDPEIRAAMQKAGAVFASLGLSLDTADGFPEDADTHALTVMQAEAARAHRAVLDDERVDPVLRKRLGKGLSISNEALADAIAQREALRQSFVRRFLLLNKFALLPVMPILTPLATETDPASSAFSAKTLYAMSRFTRFVNYLQLPAVAFPIGFDARGLPMAAQLVGPLRSEAPLLRMVEKYQAVTDWHGRIPVAVAGRIAAERELAA